MSFKYIVWHTYLETFIKLNYIIYNLWEDYCTLYIITIYNPTLKSHDISSRLYSTDAVRIRE